MTDFVLQRKNMVESQVRPSDVTDRRITMAMLDLPRERFVPSELMPLAYMDEALPVAPGRSLMAPRDFARLVQLAAIEDTDKVLVVGAGRGYSAAVVSRLGREIVALECGSEAAAAMTQVLDGLAITNVSVVTGALASGWPTGGPYDVIVVEGAVDDVPNALVDQLAPAGRLVAVAREAGVGRAIVLLKTGNTAAKRVAFEAAAPRLPGFERAPGFVF